MKTIIHVIRPLILTILALTSFTASTQAQEVSIPDPGLNAAIRAALQRPTGPLSEQELLDLTNLDASSRDIRSLEGLEAARNLSVLNLQSNQLANLTFPNGLTNLNILDLSFNPLTNCTFPSGLTNLTSLIIEASSLSSLTLPADLRSLDSLLLERNQLTNLNLPTNLTHLDYLSLAQNGLTNLTLPVGLSALTVLDLWGNRLSSFTLPAGMTNLVLIRLFFNQLTNLTLPDDLSNLGGLDLDGNRLTSLTLSSNLNGLGSLHLKDNLLTNLNLSAAMTRLRFLDVEGNQLRNFTLPAGLTNLNYLRLSENQLTSLTLPTGLTNLAVLFLHFNQLTNLTLSPDLGNLVQINVRGNQLTSLTLPAGLTNLITLVLDGNPFATFVASEPMAATQLAAVVATLRNQGVVVFTYPLAIRLLAPLQTVDTFFVFTFTGPPGIYAVLSSTNLTAWSELAAVTNQQGIAVFVDLTSGLSPQKFYRVRQQSPPANMVFIPPNTFTMGSPTNELHRNINEGPQTTVTLTRGFWIGKYEVTQGEYLSVTGTNPSEFPGDLNRPISSVSWPDATNYCWMLTQQELAAGRIPAGSQYRLPTEAEWECAARAGTTTRFSYGDDPDYASLDNYALHSFADGLNVHPVGQKLPNPWGLYDIYGNVWEWCQDWLGPLPGGAVTDPTGPDTNPIGWKIVRGGGFDFSASDCRSARRFFFPNHPALTDWNLGFRVVLVTGP